MHRDEWMMPATTENEVKGSGHGISRAGKTTIFVLNSSDGFALAPAGGDNHLPAHQPWSGRQIDRGERQRWYYGMVTVSPWRITVCAFSEASSHDISCPGNWDDGVETFARFLGAVGGLSDSQ